LGEVKLDNKQYFWYSTECIDAIPQGIDMLFVDGPPAREGTYNRYPALPMFKEKVTKDCVIIMDDVNRPDEFEISRLWAGILGRKNIAYHDVEKGMAII
jgi:Methyltransferase domain